MSTTYYFRQAEMQEQREQLEGFLFEVKQMLRQSFSEFARRHAGEACGDTVIEHTESLMHGIDQEFAGTLDTDEEFLLIFNDGSLFGPTGIPFESDLLESARQMEEKCASGALIFDEYGASWPSVDSFVTEVLLPHTDPEQRELYLEQRHG